MSEKTCPSCLHEALDRRLFDFETEVENGRGQSKLLRIPAVAADLCRCCGETFFERASRKRIVVAQREALGLLSAEAIRRLRGPRTQAEMSELLGIGQKTYTRWESAGHFQSEAFDRFLRLLETGEENWKLLERIARSKREGLGPEPERGAAG